MEIRLALWSIFFAYMILIVMPVSSATVVEQNADRKPITIGPIWHYKDANLSDQGESFELSGDYNSAINCYMESSLAYLREKAIEENQGNNDKSVEALRNAFREAKSAYALTAKNKGRGHYSISIATVPNMLLQPEDLNKLINTSKIYLIQFDSNYNLDNDDVSSGGSTGPEGITINGGDSFHRIDDTTFKNVYLELNAYSNKSEAVSGDLLRFFVDKEKWPHVVEKTKTGKMNIGAYPAEYVIGEAFDFEYTDSYGFKQKSYVPAGILHIQISEYTNLKIIVVDIDDCLMSLRVSESTNLAYLLQRNKRNLRRNLIKNTCKDLLTIPNKVKIAGPALRFQITTRF